MSSSLHRERQQQQQAKQQSTTGMRSCWRTVALPCTELEQSWSFTISLLLVKVKSFDLNQCHWISEMSREFSLWLVESVLLYGCECRTLTQELQRFLGGFDIRMCCHNDHVTNKCLHWTLLSAREDGRKEVRLSCHYQWHREHPMSDHITYTINKSNHKTVNKNHEQNTF